MAVILRGRYGRALGRDPGRHGGVPLVLGSDGGGRHGLAGPAQDPLQYVGGSRILNVVNQDAVRLAVADGDVEGGWRALATLRAAPTLVAGVVDASACQRNPGRHRRAAAALVLLTNSFFLNLVVDKESNVIHRLPGARLPALDRRFWQDCWQESSRKSRTAVADSNSGDTSPTA